MRDFLATVADLIRGPRCTCGLRVFPRDRTLHLSRNHSGDLS